MRESMIRLEKLIGKAERVLLLGHRNPDGDAVGSMVAMAEYVRSLGKEAVMYSADPVMEQLFFIYGVGLIISDEERLKDDYDLIIILDVSNFSYIGAQEVLESRIFQSNVDIVVIDHHDSNELQVNLAVVDGEASSTALLLYEFFYEIGYNFSAEVSTALLTGVVTDTGIFTNGATDERTMKVAAELIRRGANYSKVVRYTEEVSHKSYLKFWSRVLSRAVKNDKLNIVYSVILEDDIEDGREVVGGAANFFNYIPDAKAVFVFKEGDNEIKISLRSKGEVDVARLARFFGGGGHRRAAGFKVRGRLEPDGRGWRII